MITGKKALTNRAARRPSGQFPKLSFPISDLKPRGSR